MTLPPATDGSSDPTDAPPACTEIGQEWVSPRDGVTLVCVPAGAFWMGAGDEDPKAHTDTQPRHRVYLDAFWMDRTESTNAMFAGCVALDVCTPRPEMRGTTGVASRTHLDYYHDPAYSNYPVLTYTPDDAETYCACMGRRLATEAEFEKAARGTDARTYPWGDALDCAHASYLGCTKDTTDVATPLSGASPYGALNLAGNVWEWVGDWYSEDYYSQSPDTNPLGPLTGEGRVRRGGGFRSLPRDLRVTARASGNPQHYFDGQMGFRCAMSGGP